MHETHQGSLRIKDFIEQKSKQQKGEDPFFGSWTLLNSVS